MRAPPLCKQITNTLFRKIKMGQFILPSQNFNFLVKRVELTVPRLDVKMKIVPESGARCQSCHVTAQRCHCKNDQVDEIC